MDDERGATYIHLTSLRDSIPALFVLTRFSVIKVGQTGSLWSFQRALEHVDISSVT